MENNFEEEKRVLVPVDGSDRSLNTIRWIAGVEPFSHMKLVIFNVFEKVPSSYWDLSNQPMMAEGINYLAAKQGKNKRDMQSFMVKSVSILRASSFKEKNIVTKIADRKKGIARDIINEAGKGYYAVVTRRRGFTRVPGLLMGNVADKLMMKLDFLPVFFAGRKRPSKKIIVAIDNSLNAMKNVDFVSSFAGQSDCSITLLHVTRKNEEIFYDSSYGKDAVSDQKLMDVVFEKAVKKLRKTGIKEENIHHKIISNADSRAGAIAEFAQKADHNIIVLGRYGVSRVKDFFLGRVSKKVVYAASERTVCIVP